MDDNFLVSLKELGDNIQNAIVLANDSPPDYVTVMNDISRFYRKFVEPAQVVIRLERVGQNPILEQEQEEVSETRSFSAQNDSSNEHDAEDRQELFVSDLHAADSSGENSLHSDNNISNVEQNPDNVETTSMPAGALTMYSQLGMQENNDIGGHPHDGGEHDGVTSAASIYMWPNGMHDDTPNLAAIPNVDDISSNERPSPLYFVMHAIEAMENDNQQEPTEQPKPYGTIDVQSADSTTVADSQDASNDIGIQAEVAVETTQTETAEQPEEPKLPPLNITLRPKRNVVIKPAVELFLKRRRRSADERPTPTKAAKPTNDANVTLPACGESESKWERAMKIRHSKIRKTVCFTPIHINYDRFENAPEKDDEDEDSGEGGENTDNFPEAYQKNTNREMHASNSLYRTLCLLCNRKNENLVSHYKKFHLDVEIPIARPSFDMANRMRSQSDTDFIQDKDKIHGTCCFCETGKSMARSHWGRHLLAHTGEFLYHCSVCDAGFMKKGAHGKCPGKPVYICQMKGPLVGFICRDCNYLQIRREQLVKHLKNEHGYIQPEEDHHYEQIVLLPEFIGGKKRTA